MINYYKTLNVPESASELQIRKGFRSLAVKYHPDKTQTASSDEFIKIIHAYEILIDPYKRKIHDKDLYLYRNPIKNDQMGRQFSGVVYNKETLFLKALNVFLRIVLIVILIIVTTYSCEFIGNQVFKSESDTPATSFENLDNRHKEDASIEDKLKDVEEKKHLNGEIKF